MQAQSDRPVKTFSIGFHEAQYNEAHHAKAIAEHLGTEHTELYVTAEDALHAIPLLSDLYDEPFADASQIPTYLVAKMARQHVTVALSGDAGDELFCGYNRYLITHKLWRHLSKLPLWLRKGISAFITSISPGTWDGLAKIISFVLPAKYDTAHVPFSDRLYKGARVIGSANIMDLYRGLVSTIASPERFILNAIEPSTPFLDELMQPKINNNIEKMMAIDLMGYLPNDILTKVDRAAMGVSLETRIPLLDHKIVEFAWKLPIEFKLNDGIGKWILREVLYKYVPKKLIERPKMGFAIPIESWLRGSLCDWAENLLNEDRLNKEGFLNTIEVRKLWSDHLSGRRN
jgi:asparagine synthase (glutamine-hydrolysing)